MTGFRVLTRTACLFGVMVLFTACGENKQQQQKDTKTPAEATKSKAPASATEKKAATPSPTAAESTLDLRTSDAKTQAPVNTPVAADVMSPTAKPATPAASPTTAPQTAATPVEVRKIATDEKPIPVAEAGSPYLRSAANSKIKWYAWGPGAFAEAQKLGRPVLIDIGAGWCHWCHVMDADTYDNPEVAQLINDNFVAIKVDRDERPDLDDRYQTAHYLINKKTGGWPLTIFALPDGRSFESLTYVQPQTQGDQIGMIDVLKQVVKLYKEKQPAVLKQAQLVEQGVAGAGLMAAKQGTQLSEFIDRVYKSITADYDTANSGFGGADEPKFPNGPALTFLLQYYSDTEDKAAIDMVRKTLTAYYKSGMRDNVLGGFFRYTVDAGFSKPHFEKMLYVQAELLSAYSQAFAASSNQAMFREATREILRFCRETFENTDGGFYASQDADITPKDSGTYFTWTREEVEKIAGTDNDTKVFLTYYDIPEKTTDQEGRTVLKTTKKLQEVADQYKISYDAAQKALNDVRKKLHDARSAQQEFPRVDKTIIASWNGQMISAYLNAMAYTNDAQAGEFALKSMDFILKNMVSEKDGVAHSFAKGKLGTRGLLDDQVQVAAALIDCFQASSKAGYLDTAQKLMESVEAKYLDAKSGLYRDRIAADGEPGLLSMQRIQVWDNPTPSPNAVAARVWYDLYRLAGKKEYLERATRLVNAVAGTEQIEGLVAASFGRSALLIQNGAPKVVVVGPLDNPTTVEMRKAALQAFRMGKLIEVLSPEEAKKTDYPPADDGKPIAYVCTDKTCAPPSNEPAKLPDVVRTFGRPKGSDGSTTGNLEIKLPGSSGTRKKVF